MATSWGAAAAQGLEAGFGLGMRGRQQALDEEERRRRASQAEADRLERGEDRKLQRERDARADARLATQDKRLAKQDARQARLDELSMLDKEFADLQTEGSSLWTQYGGFDKVPEDVRGQYTGRVKQLRDRRSAARRAFYEPDVTEAKRDAAEKWSRIQAGQMTLDELSDDDLYRTLSVQTRRDLADFLRPKEGGPAPIEQAALDLEAGMQTGNMDLTLRAANVLLKPELAVGVGSEGRDGSEIVGKRIVQLVPHPQDPSQFVPIVEVTVKRDDGATGKYLAPISEGRGVYANDPEAMPKTLTIQQALDRVGQLSTLSAALNRPDIRARIDKGAAGPGKASADEFLAALGSVGVTPPKKQITRERVDLGNVILEREVDASGNVISEKKLGKGLAPTKPEGPTAEQRNAAAEDRRLREAEKSGLITPEEAREARRKQVLGGGKGKGGMDSPADLFKAENTLRDEYNLQTKTFTTVRDAYGKVLAAAKEQKNGPDQTAAADIALIFAYMRMLDPNSVVREGEFATAQNAAGIPDRIRNYYNRALSGNLLNDKQRNEIVGEARKVYGQQRKAQDEVDTRYRDMSKRYGLNADNVVAEAKDPAAPDLPQAARAALKEGQITTFGNGQKWTLQGGQPVQVQ